MYGWVLALLIPAMFVVVVLRGPLASLLIGDAGGACSAVDVHDTAAAFLGLFALQIPIYGLTVVSQGALQAGHRFTAPAVAPLLSSLVVIAVYLGYAAASGDGAGSLAALTTSQLWLLGAGTTLGVLVLLLTQLPTAWRNGLLVWPRLHFPADAGPTRARPGRGRARDRRSAVGGLRGVAAAGQRPRPAGSVSGVRPRLDGAPAAVGGPRVPGRDECVPAAGNPVRARRTLGVRQRRRQWRAEPWSCSGCTGAAGLATVAVPLARFLVEGAPGRPSSAELAATITALAAGVIGFALVGFGGRVLYAAHRGRLAAWVTVSGWLVGMVLAAVASWTVPRRARRARGCGRRPASVWSSPAQSWSSRSDASLVRARCTVCRAAGCRRWSRSAWPRARVDWSRAGCRGLGSGVPRRSRRSWPRRRGRGGPSRSCGGWTATTCSLARRGEVALRRTDSLVARGSTADTGGR